MICRARPVRWILLLIPAVTSSAGVPAPGPPPNDMLELWIPLAAFVIGFAGLLILRRRRTLRTEGEMPSRSPRSERVLRVALWLVVIGAPVGVVLHASAHAAQRRKTSLTMSYMRQIASAWEARATDTQQYNSAGAGITFVERRATVATVLPHTITAEQAASVLVPKYMDSFPMRDGWGNEWLLALDQSFPGNPGTPAVRYAIASPGSDGQFGPRTDGNVPCAAWECDIVFANGEFVTQFPSDDAHDLR